MKLKKRFGKTIFYIKPDGMKYAKEILNDIKQAGYRFVGLKVVTLTKRAILTLYPYLLTKPKLRQVTFDKLLGKKVIVGLLKRGNAMQGFVKMCGEHFNPELCGENTLRRKYYNEEPVKVGIKKYYPNVIHRVRNILEYYRNVAVFFNTQDFVLEKVANKLINNLKK